ncbi:MAG: acyloxyacyl hydrolase [Gammaproteobacteria bacterium]|nr:acyloxyacyl hydrolase [Gammaproteobacteria bacterium]
MATRWLLLTLGLSLATAGHTAQRITIGAGAFYPFNTKIPHDGLALLVVEADPLAEWWQLRPLAQSFITNNGNYYLGLGVGRDFAINDSWQWGVASGAGYYHKADDDYDLGMHLEFYSRIYLGWQLDDGHWLRLDLGHISNADFADHNPGSETLTLSWVNQW